MLGKLCKFSILLFLSCPLISQKLPDAPKPKLATRYDYVVWGGIVAAHTTDYFLTEECINTPTRCHEGVLPGFVWKHKPTLAATEAFFSVAQVGISYELRKHNHKDIARVWDGVNLGFFSSDDLYLNFGLLH